MQKYSNRQNSKTTVLLLIKYRTFWYTGFLNMKSHMSKNTTLCSRNMLTVNKCSMNSLQMYCITNYICRLLNLYEKVILLLTIILLTMFMVLSSWHSHCESSPGSFNCTVDCASFRVWFVILCHHKIYFHICWFRSTAYTQQWNQVQFCWLNPWCFRVQCLHKHH